MYVRKHLKSHFNQNFILTEIVSKYKNASFNLTTRLFDEYNRIRLIIRSSKCYSPKLNTLNQWKQIIIRH